MKNRLVLRQNFLGDTLYSLNSEPNKLIAIDTVEGINRIIGNFNS